MADPIQGAEETTGADGSKVEESAEGQGGEGEEGEKKKKKVEEEEKIQDDFFYNYEEHSSKAKISEESGLPEDMISL